MVKRMIFHSPMDIGKGGKSASQLRPAKMAEAFRALGYEVITVAGSTGERIKKMRWVRNNLSKLAPDFVYSELSTMPFALAQSIKRGIHPLADIAFFRACQRAGIPVGAFYRDVYWKFEVDDAETPSRFLPNYQNIARVFYRLDEVLLPHSLDAFFLPSLAMKPYVGGTDKVTTVALPPGTPDSTRIDRPRTLHTPLRLLYVGSIGGYYQLNRLIDTVNVVEGVALTLCVPEEQWDGQQKKLAGRLGNAIEVVHASGDELQSLYDQADIGALVMEPIQYRTFAAPYKFFEYLGNGLPVLATADTNVGTIVNEEGLGWTVPYDTSAIAEQLQTLVDNPSLVAKRANVVSSQKKKHSWRSRAELVASTLKKRAV